MAASTSSPAGRTASTSRVACARRRGLDFLIEVDGGIKSFNASQAVKAGADVLVAGSAVFESQDYAAAIRALRGAA